MRAKAPVQQAQRDPLTGLFDRAILDGFVDREVVEVMQGGKPLSVIVADVDHPVGDKVLAVAACFKGRLRPRDVVARYGGERLAVALPNTDAAGAVAVAERIRKIVAETAHEVGAAETLRTTMSLGCATLTAKAPFASRQGMMEAADQALYAAKRAGRNRVVTYGAPPVLLDPAGQLTQKNSTEGTASGASPPKESR
jgi:diguanylate cyclase (GGDEF)-like protein